ncbi:hypothetical protein N0V88_003901 [Collariella sp. IMI 366227]|nr:hypothetical protein N0V88_003901 [Collariella sp. IMI 366227]
MLPNRILRPAVSVEAKNENTCLVKGLQNLPPEVIFDIQKLVGWFDGWKAYRICRWFRVNFHPDRLPAELKLVGVLEAEQRYGRYGCDEFDQPGAKRPDGKTPPWYACYHCFTFQSFHHFELHNHHNKTPKKADNSPNDDSQSNHSSPRIKSEHTYSPQQAATTPPANPHYDPTLTGSRLAAQARLNGRYPNYKNNRNPAASTTITNSSSDSGRRPHAENLWGERAVFDAAAELRRARHRLLFVVFCFFEGGSDDSLELLL